MGISCSFRIPFPNEDMGRCLLSSVGMLYTFSTEMSEYFTHHNELARKVLKLRVFFRLVLGVAAIFITPFAAPRTEKAPTEFP